MSDKLKEGTPKSGQYDFGPPQAVQTAPVFFSIESLSLWKYTGGMQHQKIFPIRFFWMIVVPIFSYSWLSANSHSLASSPISHTTATNQGGLGQTLSSLWYAPVYS